jgi:hypothetical protein
MISAMTLRDSSATDIALHSGNRLVRQVTGLTGAPGIRQVVRPRPNRHGAINDTSHMHERAIVVSGVLKGANEAGVWTEYDAVQSVMFDAIGTDRTLKWTRASSALALQATVRVHDLFDGPLSFENGLFHLPYQATFLAEDPREYLQTETTATGAALSGAAGGLVFSAAFPWRFTPSGAGAASVNNTGTIPTPPVFNVYGAVSSPQVLLVGSSPDERIVLTGSVSDGDYLEVDVFNRTIKLNGTTNRLNLLDFTGTTWFDLPVGSKTIRLLGATFNANARVDVLYRPAYL